MIDKLKLENWKSHFESEFEFSSGVNVLVGEMGSGKSSVLHAISFALFGTTPALKSRAVKLDNLIRRNPSPAKEASVEVEFTLGEDSFQVKRVIERDNGTKEAELRKNGSMIESPSPNKVTEQVEKILDMDYDLFSRAIYSEQNNLDYFLNLRAGKRKKKIDELLKLHKFEGARKNTVTIKNRIQDLRETRENDLESLSKKEELKKIPELEDEVEGAKEELEGLQEKIASVRKKFGEIREDFKDYSGKKEKHEKLKEKKTRITSDLESLKKRMDQEIQDISLTPENFDGEDIEEKISQVEEGLELLEKKEKEIDDIETKIAENRKLIEKIDEELEDLESKSKKLEGLEKISKSLEEKKKDVKDLERNIQDTKTKIGNLEEHIEPLEEGVNKCPVCGSELNEEKREKLLEERNDSLGDLKEKKERMENELEEVKEKLEELENKKEELMEFKNIDEKIKGKKKEKKDLKSDLEAFKEKLNSFKDEIGDMNRKKLEEDKSEFEVLEKIKDMEKEEKELHDKKEHLDDMIEKLDFKEEKLEELREEKNEMDKKLEVLDNKKESRKELIEEKEKRLKGLEEEKQKIEDLEEKIKKYEKISDFLEHFENSLEETQINLRERFVGSLNNFMDEIWQKVYPYDDYSSIRLNTEEDYALELMNGEEEWIPVEGEVSGGERHTAALSLRISLALILSPGMKILILDEPTHNLDVRAIEDLGETMKTKVSDLIDQLFLITHEERLESAVTGNFYKLKKKSTENGLTEIVESGSPIE